MMCCGERPNAVILLGIPSGAELTLARRILLAVGIGAPIGLFVGLGVPLLVVFVILLWKEPGLLRRDTG